MIGRAKRGFGLLALFVLGAAAACNGRTATRGGSETNWLAMCRDDADCSVGHCVCGRCTEPCTSDASCPSGSGPDRA